MLAEHVGSQMTSLMMSFFKDNSTNFRHQSLFTGLVKYQPPGCLQAPVKLHHLRLSLWWTQASNMDAAAQKL